MGEVRFNIPEAGGSVMFSLFYKKPKPGDLAVLKVDTRDHDNVYIWSSCDEDAQIVHKLDPGSLGMILEILDRAWDENGGKCVKIISDGVTGWLSSSYLGRPKN